MQSDNQPDCSECCPQNFEDLSFDDWTDLHDSEPERFEKYRQKLLNDLIDSAPERAKARLRGLIFQMDAESKRSKSLMAYNIRLAAMMMEMMGELRHQANRLVANNPRDMEQDQTLVKTAKVLSFNRATNTDDESY